MLLLVFAWSSLQFVRQLCVRVRAKILTVDGGLGAMGLDGRAHCIMLAMKRNACSAILTVCTYNCCVE